ncbi:DNA helicase RecQ [Hellea balneolensis]|uniref:DNA helicase RecQ n=1 Tax=Hellea balneolensis TaxID=287478 RepID=UPI00041F8B5E|nr:DNA helicase RecQ [Hellea balneolensis]
MSTPESIIQNTFGFPGFRPGQKGVIDALMDGQSVLAVMPTGAGKSLCYQIPALLFDRPTIVISPLVALMDNQVAGLRMNGVKVGCLHSGQSREENIAEWQSVTHGGAKLLYMSPERLMTGRMLSAMKALNPSMFVVDEAHCVSKWGPAFRPEYADLQRLKDLFPDARVAAFTATADELTREDIAGKLFGGQGKTIVQGFDRPNLSLAVSPLRNRSQQLLEFMKTTEGQSGIVYCLSRKNTEKFAGVLEAAGYKALPYHAGMPSETRFENQERFMAEEGVVMVATIAFGMGIDKPDIRFVYHMNIPGSLEAFYQEIGRAGRDGQPAVTALLYGLDDIRMRRQFISDDGSDSDHQMREHKRLDALLGYAESSGCRRRVLLNYFGESQGPCGNCDNCISPPEMIDATEPAKALFSAISQTGQRFGTTHVIAVARGETTDRIVQFSHDSLDAFGKGRDYAKPYMQALIRQAVASGIISMDISRYGALTLEAGALDILAGQAKFKCKDLATRRAAKSSRKARKALEETALSPDEQSLLAKLKSLRMEFSREIGKPAFVVFSDATLMDMVSKTPTTREEMLDVSGVGDTKFQRYGEAFLDAIRTA